MVDVRISGDITHIKDGTQLTTQSDLPDSVYAFPNQRKEPLTDAQHVRNAVARFDQVIDVSDAGWPPMGGRVPRAWRNF